MLGDIVQNSSFPAAELERERQVILHEMSEDDDDALATADKLFDTACFRAHPLAQPVIGNRANIRRFTPRRAARLRARPVLGRQRRRRRRRQRRSRRRSSKEAEAAFAAMRAGEREPRRAAGVRRRRRLEGAGRLQPDPRRPRLSDPVGARRPPRERGRRGAVRRRHELAADGRDPRAARPRLLRLVHGRGQRARRPVRRRGVDRAGARSTSSSPRCAACSRRRPRDIAPIDLERARNQMAVRSLRAQERPSRRLEDAALDLFVHGRVRPRAELTARTEDVTAAEVRDAFAAMLVGARRGRDRRQAAQGLGRARPRAVRADALRLRATAGALRPAAATARRWSRSRRRTCAARRRASSSGPCRRGAGRPSPWR